ncbi:MAG: tetratricopeptide repeat protein [Candidatus Baltobacteraceae bacterium]
MKRSVLVGLFIAAVTGLVGFGGMSAQARGRGPAPSPSPSAPVAVPTASPEPPSIAIPRLIAKIKANPNDQQALTDLALQYLGLSRPDLSLPITQHLLQLGDKTAQVYYFDGTANENLGKTSAAISDYEQASNIDPTNIGVLGALTSAYLRTNRNPDAERVAKRAVTFNKDDARAYINLGLVYATEKKFDDARTQFEESFKLAPTDPTPLLQAAQTYVVQNSIPNALAMIDRAIAVDPKNIQALVFKGDVYAKSHDVANASAAYDVAIAAGTSDDQKVALIDHKAAFLALEKQFPTAEAAYQQAIAQYPKVSSAHVAFGDYYANGNHFDRAQQQWLTALSINKDDTQALGRMGEYKLRTAKISDTVGYLKHLTDIAPDGPSLAELGQAYTQLHDYAQAKDACRKSYQAQPSPETLGCIAGADFELKNFKEGAQVFDFLDKNVPQFLNQNPQLLFIMGKCYEQTHQKPKALGTYKRLLGLMKKNSAGYKQVGQLIAQLSGPAPKGKVKH